MGCCNKECGLIAGAVIGAVVAILGGVLIPVGNRIIKGTVEKESVIEPGSTAYDNWVTTGAAVYRQFWLFDVKNPVEVVQYGAKPVVVEKGPYTYRTRYLPRANITFNPNDTVSFLLPLNAIFEPAMSVGPEEDKVTSLNLAVAVIHPFLNALIKSSNSSLFQYRTVKELLWGYKDPMLKSTLGVFVPYNNTYDGYYTVYTGKEDISRVGIIDRWRGERSLPYWNDTYCDMINGTDASSFPPFLDKKKPLYFFSSDICRSVSASYEKTMDLKGIKVYRYTLLPSTLASPTVNPDNRCFCKNPKTTKNCTLAGVLDIGPCKDARPIYISLPHFLQGSPSLREAILGLNPSEEHHQTFLDVEPTTGFSLRFAKRIQLNMMYGPSNVITVLEKVKDYTVFPILWMNETAALDEATADMFKKELISRIQMLEIIQQSLLGTGLTVFALCLIFYCVVRRRRSKSMF
ncbi:platelet glycoprotein 4 isoform X2 [Hippoglossus hippoglossus]|uniref:platelet glycoprotein 4 isoform X2 n=1 Tax=Hippoglossus hippoglossus TaxID=8267 RepID=UPI00148DF4C3|nr:platelet glycoprotein 4 isoform X2 [Hippoglossus hippoglossus]